MCVEGREGAREGGGEGGRVRGWEGGEGAGGWEGERANDEMGSCICMKACRGTPIYNMGVIRASKLFYAYIPPWKPNVWLYYSYNCLYYSYNKLYF